MRIETNSSWKEPDSHLVIACCYFLAVVLFVAAFIVLIIKEIPQESYILGFWFASGFFLLCMANIMHLRRRVRNLEKLVGAESNGEVS